MLILLIHLPVLRKCWKSDIGIEKGILEYKEAHIRSGTIVTLNDGYYDPLFKLILRFTSN